MKTILVSHFKDDDLNKALQEVQLLQKLEHPNIVKYKDSFTVQNYLCVVTEYFKEGSVHDRIKKQLEKQE